MGKNIRKYKLVITIDNIASPMLGYFYEVGNGGLIEINSKKVPCDAELVATVFHEIYHWLEDYLGLKSKKKRKKILAQTAKYAASEQYNLWEGDKAYDKWEYPREKRATVFERGAMAAFLEVLSFVDLWKEIDNNAADKSQTVSRRTKKRRRGNVSRLPAQKRV